jgi:hypothetical protein
VRADPRRVEATKDEEVEEDVDSRTGRGTGVLLMEGGMYGKARCVRARQFVSEYLVKER